MGGIGQQYAMQMNLRQSVVAGAMGYGAQLSMVDRRIAGGRAGRAFGARPGSRRIGDVFINVVDQNRDDGVIRILQLRAT